jgi:hypothetical protein
MLNNVNALLLPLKMTELHPAKVNHVRAKNPKLRTQSQVRAQRAN